MIDLKNLKDKLALVQLLNYIYLYFQYNLLQKITKTTTTSILKELVHMLFSLIKLILKFSFSIFNMFTTISKTRDKETLQSLCVHCYESPYSDSCSMLNEGQNLSVVTECKLCSNW